MRYLNKRKNLVYQERTSLDGAMPRHFKLDCQLTIKQAKKSFERNRKKNVRFPFSLLFQQTIQLHDNLSLSSKLLHILSPLSLPPLFLLHM